MHRVPEVVGRCGPKGLREEIAAISYCTETALQRRDRKASEGDTISILEGGPCHVPGENALRERKAGTRTDARAPTDATWRRTKICSIERHTPGPPPSSHARLRDERPPKALPSEPFTVPHFDATQTHTITLPPS